MKEIRELQQEGLSLTEIHRLTGLSRDTIRKSLNGSDPPRSRTPRPSQWDPFVPDLKERRAAGVWNAVPLHRDLKSRG